MFRRFGVSKGQGIPLLSMQKSNFSKTTGLQESSTFNIKHTWYLDKDKRNEIDSVRDNPAFGLNRPERVAKRFNINNFSTDPALAKVIDNPNYLFTMKGQKNDNLSANELEDVRNYEISVNNNNNYKSLNQNMLHSIKFSNNFSLSQNNGVNVKMKQEQVGALPDNSRSKFLAVKDHNGKSRYNDNSYVWVVHHLVKLY